MEETVRILTTIMGVTLVPLPIAFIAGIISLIARKKYTKWIFLGFVFFAALNVGLYSYIETTKENIAASQRQKEKNYDNALEKARDGKLQEAIGSFSGLGTYRDSEEWVKLLIKLDSKEDPAAIKTELEKYHDKEYASLDSLQDSLKFKNVFIGCVIRTIAKMEINTAMAYLLIFRENIIGIQNRGISLAGKTIDIHNSGLNRYDSDYAWLKRTPANGSGGKAAIYWRYNEKKSKSGQLCLGSMLEYLPASYMPAHSNEVQYLIYITDELIYVGDYSNSQGKGYQIQTKVSLVAFPSMKIIKTIGSTLGSMPSVEIWDSREDKQDSIITGDTNFMEINRLLAEAVGELPIK